MKEQKNIERLFQEKFKDFEAIPPQESWDIIAARLQKKKKKRIIPFWFQLSGIAASLVIIGTLVWNYQIKNNTLIENNKAVVYEEANHSATNKNANFEKKNTQIIRSESKKNNQKITEKNKPEAIVNQYKIQQNGLQKPKDAVVIRSKDNKKYNTTNVASYKSTDELMNRTKENTITVHQTKSIKNNATKPSNIQLIKDKIVLNTAKNEKLVKNQQNKLIDKTNQKNINSDKIDAFLEEDKKLNTTHYKAIDKLVNHTKDKTISKNSEIAIKNKIIEPSKNQLIANEKASHNDKDAILTTNQQDKLIDKTNHKNINSDKIDAFFKENNPEITLTNNTNLKEKNLTNIDTLTKINSKDSTLVEKIAIEKNLLEELLAAKENGKNEDEKEKEKRSRWAISSNASPVYFNSLANGSSLDQEFENNPKTFTNTLSYGIGGSYVLKNKLSIRAGINNINLSYSTNDVVYQTRLNATANNNVPTISRNSNGSNVTFTSKNAIQNSLSGDVENVKLNNTGAIEQDLSFIEVPLELSYKIIDKKFGVEFIGGMSTLFLNNNTVSLVTDGMEMTVGKANNLNKIHFSSNVGLGFKYNFWKNFNANFQPMFKYQINTFSENSGNFKPYFIGLYSGVSFSF